MKQLTKDLIEWTRNYLNSFGGNTKAVIGISGGCDSSVVAAACVAAVGKDRVIGILLPNGDQYDIDKAKELVNFLGITSYEFNIKDISKEFENLLSKNFANVAANKAYYSNNPARIRMVMLYAIAALLGDSRVANTCNASEDYLGWNTKNGDDRGDFSPISLLYKDEVIALGKELNLPNDLINKVPEDGMSGKSDEDNFGFTYADLHTYIRTGHLEDPEKVAKIVNMHQLNLHKLLPMPQFKPKR